MRNGRGFIMMAAEPLQVGKYQGLSDEEVVNRVRAGDLALYEILMRRHNQRLYRAVRAILRDENEVEDILQEAYLAAYRNLAEFEGRARFSTWLVRIAVNRALDLRRQRAKVIALNPKGEDGSANNVAESTSASFREDPEQQSARLELGRLLENAIDALPRAFRGVYVLRDVDGMSTEETAKSLGLEVNTVKTRLHRARALLRERLVLDFDAAALQAFPFGAGRCNRLVAVVLDRLARSPR
jgi:RNA polymerase sigma-70 factor (ECF subfamily)